MLAIVAGILVGLAAFWMMSGLAYPARVVDFAPGVLLPLGLLRGIGGSVAGIVTRNRAPEEDVAAGGAPADVLVRNDDAIVHTFTVPELGIDRTVGPGSEALVEVTADPGTYAFYCRPHADLSQPDPARAGMAGTLVAT